MDLISYFLNKIIKSGEGDYDDGQDDDSGKRYLTILESLPFILRNTLFEFTELFGDVKNVLPFDESILNEATLSDENNDDDNNDDDNTENQALLYQRKQTNNKLISFVFVNKLVVDMLSSSSSCSFEFKVKLGSELRRTEFIDNVMHILFRIMPDISRGLNKVIVDMFRVNEIDSELLGKFESSYPLWFENEAVQRIACIFYKNTLQLVPAIVRDWWNIQPKRIADQVEKFSIK